MADLWTDLWVGIDGFREKCVCGGGGVVLEHEIQ